MNQNNAHITNQYLDRQIQNASPAEQLVMLYDGAIRFLLKSKQAIANKDIQERCNNNQRAMEIINYLTGILDMEQGGDISMRLLRIYTFITQQILEVDIQNDPAIIDEIIPHLKMLRQSWVAIANNTHPGQPEQPAEQATPTNPKISPNAGASTEALAKKSALA